MSAASPPPSGYKLCPQCRQIYPADVELCTRDHARLIVERRIIVGKYILLNRIGNGPTSEVYAAEQPQLGRMVAIKLLQRDVEVERHFDSQVRSIGAVKHEHVVTLYDSGRADDGRPYIAMEYLEGEDLAEHLLRAGAMAARRALFLWRQAVSAIAAAHRRHIVHGDLNPTNLFLTHRESETGPEEIIKVIDFRIGMRTAPHQAAESSLRGDGMVRYVAPEQQHSGQPSPRADVYSLGLVLLEMLSGRLPWESAVGGKEEVSRALLVQLEQSQHWEPGSSGPLSRELLALIGDILRRDPARRPADAGELLLLIRQLPDGVPPAASLVSGRRADQAPPAGVSPAPSQSTEPDWLAGAKQPKDRSVAGDLADSPPVDEPAPANEPTPADESTPADEPPSDALLPPKLGVETVDEPEWLTGTQKQYTITHLPSVTGSALDGPTVEAKSLALDPTDPFYGSETPQMGVAVLSGLLQQLKDSKEQAAAPVPTVPAAPHWSRIVLRMVLVVLVFGGLGGLLALLARSRWPEQPGSAFGLRDLATGVDGLASRPTLPVTDLRAADLTRSSEPAGRAVAAAQVAAHVVDLGISADAAGEPGKADAGAIKVRFLYDESAVTSIECNQESLIAPRAADKHSSGVDAILRSGGFCRVSGPYGSKTYKFDTLVQRRPDPAGFRRVHIRINEAGDGELAAPAKKDPDAKVAPRPDLPAPGPAPGPAPSSTPSSTPSPTPNPTPSPTPGPTPGPTPVSVTEGSGS